MPDKFIVPERVTREAYIDLLEQFEALRDREVDLVDAIKDLLGTPMAGGYEQRDATAAVRSKAARLLVVSNPKHDRGRNGDPRRPLIADVVEAAERFHAGPSDDYRNTDEESAENETNYWKLDSALTALREHLGKKA